MLALLLACSEAPPPPPPARVVVLAVDGLDPDHVEGLAPRLPALAEALDAGRLRPLQTTTPAQCAPAWTSFATGTLPGTHGVLGDLHVHPAGHEDLAAFRYRPPTFGAEGLAPGRGSALREGESFWSTAAQAGVPVSVLAAPFGYPAEALPGGRMLAGRGMPDLELSEGRGRLLSSKAKDRAEEGLRVDGLERRGDVYRAMIGGPSVPGLGRPELEAFFGVDRTTRSVHFDVHGTKVVLAEGETSDWLTLHFPLGAQPAAQAQVRFTVVEAFNELELYLSPLTVEPHSPWMALSEPAGWAAELEAAHGPFHTQGFSDGLPAVEAGLLPLDSHKRMLEADFDQQVALLQGELERDEARLIVAGFSLPEQATAAGLPLADSLERVDRAVASVQAQLRPQDHLLLVSDHGQQPLEREVDLDVILGEAGLDARVVAGGVVLGDAQPREVVQLLQGLELSGERPVAAVLPADEVYGSQPPGSPDLLVQLASGWGLGSSGVAVRPSPRPAGHGSSLPSDTAGLVMLPQAVEGPLHIADIAPTVLFLLGVPAPSHYEGKLLLSEESQR